jgi:soluble lytic murein transglycosylase-like protein
VRKRFASRTAATGALAAALLAAAAPAEAELIVFQEGRTVKAAGYRVIGEELEIELPGGGSYRVDLDRVERILDDEIESPATLEIPEPPAGEPALYDLSYAAARKPLFGSRYDAIIVAEAKRHDVDAALVSAVIRAESNYQPRSVSRKGARGLMQLMPATARRMGVRRPFDPRDNVRGGVRYLRQLADRFESRPELVLAAYNAGEAAVEAAGGVPPYRETVEYVRRILSWWKPAEVRAAADPPAGLSP